MNAELMADFSRIATMDRDSFYRLALETAEQGTVTNPLTSADIAALILKPEIEEGVVVTRSTFKLVRDRVDVVIEAVTNVSNPLMKAYVEKMFSATAKKLGFLNTRPSNGYVWVGGSVKPYTNPFGKALIVNTPVLHMVLAVAAGDWDNRIYIVRPNIPVAKEYVEISKEDFAILYKSNQFARYLKECSINLSIPYDAQSLVYLIGKEISRFAQTPQASGINQKAWDYMVKTVE